MRQRALVGGLVFIVSVAGCGGSSDAFDANGAGAGGAAGGDGSAGNGGSAGDGAGGSSGAAGDGGADAAPDVVAEGGGGAAGAGGASTDGAVGDGATDAQDGAASDAAPVCLGAGECTGFTGTYIDDADSYKNCAGATHQVDCCGKRRVFGVNHGERPAFCAAEATCRGAYPSSSGCSDPTITTDSGDTTTDLGDVRVRCALSSGTKCICETFVCTDDSCKANSGPIGSCGP